MAARQKRRVAPRPRGERGDVLSRISWDRLGRVALVIVLTFVLVSYIQPTLNLFEHWQSSKSERAQLSSLETRNRELRRELRELDTPRGLENAARRIGMVREGERAYLVKPRER